MLTCKSDAKQIWICELDRDGHHQWILWSANGQYSFRVPPEWHVNQQELVSGAREPVEDADIQLGPAPILLYSSAPGLER